MTGTIHFEVNVNVDIRLTFPEVIFSNSTRISLQNTSNLLTNFSAILWKSLRLRSSTFVDVTTARCLKYQLTHPNRYASLKLDFHHSLMHSSSFPSDSLPTASGWNTWSTRSAEYWTFLLKLNKKSLLEKGSYGNINTCSYVRLGGNTSCILRRI